MRILLILLLVNIKLNSYADWFNGSDIDYWGENKKIQIDNNQQNNLKKNNNVISFNSEIRAKDKEKFNWSNYKNPSNIEFYDDGGDFVPNRPWREVLANPTKENIKNYMEWQSKKISITNEVSKLMAENADTPIPLSQQPSLDINKLSKINQVNEKKINWQSLQVLYFYKTKCVFCQKSIPIVETLKEHNVLFIPVQLDWKDSEPIYKESVNFDEKLQKAYQIKGTPTWIIRRADIENSDPLIIEGYVNTTSMEEAIKRLF